MKVVKLLVVALGLSLVGCSTNNSSENQSSVIENSTSEKLDYVLYENGLNADGYVYWFYIDYQFGGKLVIARKLPSEDKYVEYKTFPLGKYDSHYRYANYQGKEYVYDYGDYALWVKSGY